MNAQFLILFQTVLISWIHTPLIFVASALWFVNSTWMIASYNAYLFEDAFFLYVKHINFKLECLRWAPEVQGVGIIQRSWSFITVWITKVHSGQAQFSPAIPVASQLVQWAPSSLPLSGPHSHWQHLNKKWITPSFSIFLFLVKELHPVRWMPFNGVP